MPTNTILKRCAYATMASIMLLGLSPVAQAQDLPSFMAPIAGRPSSSPADTATKNVLALNSMMFELYDDAASVFKANLLSKHPVILGLFSGAGGRLILYRPGMAPLEAPSVPIVYQLLKSVGHSTMALTEIVGPYLDNAANQSWRSSMAAYRARTKSALDGLDATPMPADWRDNSRIILENNIAFMDDCLAKGVISFAALQAFAKKQAPYLKHNIHWAAQTQVGHWMNVIGEWKTMLGNDWEKTYDASNDRLMLIETISFTTTPDKMLTSLIRIIADRSVGALFFGNYYLMDYELMGGDARAAIIAEAEKRGMRPFLPPAVPFGSKQWPTLITPGPGPTSLADVQ